LAVLIFIRIFATENNAIDKDEHSDNDTADSRILQDTTRPESMASFARNSVERDKILIYERAN
jgi:hypothetical protein